MACQTLGLKSKKVLAAKVFLLLTKMDLIEFRSSALIGKGLGGLAAWDGGRSVNVPDGPSTTHSKRLCGIALKPQTSTCRFEG